MKTSDGILIITTTFSALMAGLFYAYSCSVSLGLGKLSDTDYIKAMQSINREIQNPVFFSCFFGLLILLPLTVYLNYESSLTFKFKLLITATFCYYLGVFFVTVFGNVSLNDTLENFDAVHQTKQAIKMQRALFENRWNTFNNIRTVFSIITVVLLIIVCVGGEK
ncbi:anthrone oxygenase family protein [Flavobacterium sp.]|uniref:anthrone oxygenase family protein n=1 Tax=Flavobacterium sp. TaxID=239 RepID=UPI00262645F3|nr:anthrone oxygenase family protein [Flavobacterium sp.]